MARIKPEQLRSEFYIITGSFKGNLQGVADFANEATPSFTITGDDNLQQDIFLVKLDNGNGEEDKVKVNKDGILTLTELDYLPDAPPGGIAYHSSSFFVGLENF